MSAKIKLPKLTLPEPRTETVQANDGQNVVFDHYRFGHNKVVIIAHGFFNSRKALLLKLLGQELSSEYDIIIMDFRGHGDSPGLFYWTAKEYQDLLAVLAFARPEYSRVGVIGFSLGAANSLIAAAKTQDFDSVIAVSAPVEFRKIEYHFWELDMENDIFFNLTGMGRAGKGVRPGPLWFKKDKPIQAVEKINCPVLYIHGEADWLIKPWHSEKLCKLTRSQKRLVIIKNGPHAEYLVRKNREETVKEIREWLGETM